MRWPVADNELNKYAMKYLHFMNRFIYILIQLASCSLNAHANMTS